MKTSVSENKLPEFSKRFNQLRGDKTQEEFAKFLGISRPTVGFYENGDRLPDCLVLRNISEKCDVSADWLLGLSDVKTPEANIQAICHKTGLSENCIRILELIYSVDKNAKYGWKYGFSDTINQLVECEPGNHTIPLISQYLSLPEINTSFMHFINTDGSLGSIKREEFDPDSSFIKYPHIIRNSNIVENCLLLDIQDSLIDLRESLLKENHEEE